MNKNPWTQLEDAMSCMPFCQPQLDDPDANEVMLSSSVHRMERSVMDERVSRALRAQTVARTNLEEDGLLTVAGFRYEKVETRAASAASDVLVRNCSSCQGNEYIRIHGGCRKLFVNKCNYLRLLCDGALEEISVTACDKVELVVGGAAPRTVIFEQCRGSRLLLCKGTPPTVTARGTSGVLIQYADKENAAKTTAFELLNAAKFDAVAVESDGDPAWNHFDTTSIGPVAGVGLTLKPGLGGVMQIDRVELDSAAGNSGKILRGDLLHSVDGVPTKHRLVSEVTDMLIGREGTSVMLAVQSASVSTPTQTVLLQRKSSERPFSSASYPLVSSSTYKPPALSAFSHLALPASATALSPDVLFEKYVAQHEQYVAKHNYTARHPDELSFQIGEVITRAGASDDEGWIEGRIGTREGHVPLTHVDSVPAAQSAGGSNIPPLQHPLALRPPASSQAPTSSRDTPGNTLLSPDFLAKFGLQPAGGHASAPVSSNSLLSSQALASTRPVSPPALSLPPAPAPSHHPALPLVLPHTHAPPTAPVPLGAGGWAARPTVSVKHNYTARNHDELSLKMGDEITLLGPSEDEGWHIAELNGKRGQVPGTHILVGGAPPPVQYSTLFQASNTATQNGAAQPDPLGNFSTGGSGLREEKHLFDSSFAITAAVADGLCIHCSAKHQAGMIFCPTCKRSLSAPYTGPAASLHHAPPALAAHGAQHV